MTRGFVCSFILFILILKLDLKVDGYQLLEISFEFSSDFVVENIVANNNPLPVICYINPDIELNFNYELTDRFSVLINELQFNIGMYI